MEQQRASPRRPYRPKDPNEWAHLMGRLSTGQETERYEDEEPQQPRRPWWLAWLPRWPRS